MMQVILSSLHLPKLNRNGTSIDRAEEHHIKEHHISIDNCKIDEAPGASVTNRH